MTNKNTEFEKALKKVTIEGIIEAFEKSYGNPIFNNCCTPNVSEQNNDIGINKNLLTADKEPYSGFNESFYLYKKYKKYIKYPLKDGQFANENLDKFYLIRNKRTGLFKVGITNNLLQRLNSIVTAIGCDVQYFIGIGLQHYYDEHPKYIEKFLLEEFKDKRTYGEWLSLSVKDVLYIRDMIWQIEGEFVDDNCRYFLSQNTSKEHYFSISYKISEKTFLRIGQK